LVQFDDLLYQIKADTGTGDTSRCPGPKIALEQPRQVFRIDPDTIIANRYFDVSSLYPCRDANFGGPRRILDSI
jgi:hypothetical protein